MYLALSIFAGFLCYILVRVLFFGIYTVEQNERAVLTSFGRASRTWNLESNSTNPLQHLLSDDEVSRYQYPQVNVKPPGGPYFRFPWQKVYKVSVATETVNMALDPESSQANSNGTTLEAVTRDQLNIGLKGQIRFRVSEKNLYAYLFGVKTPLVHVMGYFVSVLRERISNFEAKASSTDKLSSEVEQISINDLRKNLRDINDFMVQECKSAEARYGVALDASLITEIEPPHEVESALAAINTAHNNVSSEISRAQALADQTIVQSRRAVEIETLKVQAEVQPLKALAEQLQILNVVNDSDISALEMYVQNSKLSLLSRAKKVFYSYNSINQKS
jgi:regulator of protease activity HflC (stomatin/prohibitin superfamily)